MRKIKALLREFVSELLAITRASSFSRTPKGSFTILTFHRVLPDELRGKYPYPQLVVTPEELEWIVSSLKPHFQIESVSNSCKIIENKTQVNPLLSVTFDDGQLDNLVYGAPILNRLGVNATFYIPTSYIGSSDLLWHDVAGFAWQFLEASNNNGEFLAESTSNIGKFSTLDGYLNFLKSTTHQQRENEITAVRKVANNFPEWARMLTWKEVNELQNQGFEIGSHAATHELLADLSISQQKLEIDDSYSKILSHTGFEPSSFCYPNGDYNNDTLQLIANSKYTSAVTTNWGMNFSDTNNFKLNRYDMDTRFLRRISGELSVSRLQFRLSRFQPIVS